MVPDTTIQHSFTWACGKGRKTLPSLPLWLAGTPTTVIQSGENRFPPPRLLFLARPPSPCSAPPNGLIHSEGVCVCGPFHDVEPPLRTRKQACSEQGHIEGCRRTLSRLTVSFARQARVNEATRLQCNRPAR
jgi:hypothetical protein